MRSTMKQFLASQAYSHLIVSSCSQFLFLWIPLILALVVPFATSQKELLGFDPDIPIPEVTYISPKSSLLQLAWSTPLSDKITHYKVLATDISLKNFTCENENHDKGYCTISGLSADTTYNVTVAGCSDVACGTPAVVSIRTATTPRLFFGTIFAIFVVLVVLAFAVLNYEVVGELLGPCWNTVKTKLYRRQSFSPEAPQDAEATSPQEPAESPETRELNDITNDSSLACSSEGIAGLSTPSELTTDNEVSSEKNQ